MTSNTTRFLAYISRKVRNVSYGVLCILIFAKFLTAARWRGVAVRSVAQTRRRVVADGFKTLVTFERTRRTVNVLITVAVFAAMRRSGQDVTLDTYNRKQST